MTARRFQPGQRIEVGGIELAVSHGKKAPGDCRLDLRAREWTSVPMSLGFLMADFFFENEEVLYPPAQGNLGGAYYLREVRRATRMGWLLVARQLERERAASQSLFDAGEPVDQLRRAKNQWTA